MALLIAALSVSYVDNVYGLLHGLWETNTLALLPSLLRHLTKCAMHFFFTPSVLVARRLVDVHS